MISRQHRGCDPHGAARRRAPLAAATPRSSRARPRTSGGSFRSRACTPDREKAGKQSSVSLPQAQRLDRTPKVRSASRWHAMSLGGCSVPHRRRLLHRRRSCSPRRSPRPSRSAAAAPSSRHCRRHLRHWCLLRPKGERVRCIRRPRCRDDRLRKRTKTYRFRKAIQHLELINGETQSAAK